MGLKCELKTLMQERGEQDGAIKKFKDDVYEALHHISDFKKIKKSKIFEFCISMHSRVLKNIEPNSRVLDIGCNDLSLSKILKRRALHGIDSTKYGICSKE